MKILVTGGSGFIGRHLVAALNAEGHHVLTLSRSAEKPIGSEGHWSGEVEDDGAREWARGADAIIHLAGLSDASLSLDRPLEYGRVNTFGALNMLEAAREGGGRIILASSQRVYKPSELPVREDSPLQPREPYAYSKLAAESWARMYADLYGLSVVAVRLFSVYGPGQRAGRGASGVASIFVDRALRCEDLIVMGEGRRDFTYVTDVVAGLLAALRWAATGPRCDTFNLATGVGTSLVDLATLVKELTASTSSIRVVPGPRESYIADTTAAGTRLGFSARVPLRQGLRRYVQWYSQGLAQGPSDA